MNKKYNNTLREYGGHNREVATLSGGKLESGADDDHLVEAVEAPYEMQLWLRNFLAPFKKLATVKYDGVSVKPTSTSLDLFVDDPNDSEKRRSAAALAEEMRLNLPRLEVGPELSLLSATEVGLKEDRELGGLIRENQVFVFRVKPPPFRGSAPPPPRAGLTVKLVGVTALRFQPNSPSCQNLSFGTTCSLQQPKSSESNVWGLKMNGRAKQGAILKKGKAPKATAKKVGEGTLMEVVEGAFHWCMLVGSLGWRPGWTMRWLTLKELSKNPRLRP
jgi:hypothetical protein